MDDQDRPAHQQPASQQQGRSPAAKGQRRPKGIKFSGGPGDAGSQQRRLFGTDAAILVGDSLAQRQPGLSGDEQSRRRPRLGPGPDGRGRGGRGAEAEVAAAEGGRRRLQPRRQFLLPHQHRPSMPVRLRSPSNLAA
jgi:hypothetical protein